MTTTNDVRYSTLTLGTSAGWSRGGAPTVVRALEETENPRRANHIAESETPFLAVRMHVRCVCGSESALTVCFPLVLDRGGRELDGQLVVTKTFAMGHFLNSIVLYTASL